MTSEPTSLLKSLVEYVEYYADLAPGDEAVVFENDRVTYEDLRLRVEQCAKALLASGIKKGDRVAMLSTPRIEFWVVFLACASIGAIWVGLNPRYKLEEFQYVVKDCQPRLLIFLSQFEGRSYRSDIGAIKRANSCLETLVSIGEEIPGADLWEDFLSAGVSISNKQHTLAREKLESMDPALIVYTSGSTGNPKGALLTHYGICFGSTMQTTHFKVDKPVLIVNFPINHVACVADSCATTLVKGGKIIFQERFDPQEVLETTEKERCNIWGGVPTMLQLQITHPAFATTDFSSVELILWGGAAMPENQVRQLQSIAPRLMAVYGMTELSTNTTFTDEGADSMALAGSIGKPDPSCPCRIVLDSGEEAVTGEVGEIQFKGRYLLHSYWARPEATQAAFTDDGWFKTGDLGLWMDNGNIKLVGRLHDMYKSGGYNVYPREIEIVLEQIPAVNMAAVIGVADETFQEVGHAYVLLNPGAVMDEESLGRICKEKLANYKVPKTFFIKNELPMLPVGKIDKQALKHIESKDIKT